MKKILFSMTTLSIFVLHGNAQNIFPATGSAGIGTNAPVVSSLLDMRSITKGVLFPRMTSAQRAAIVAPATGLLVYQTDGSTGVYYYNGTGWARLVTSSAAPNLANLSAVAINQSLVANANGTLDLGSTTRKWRKGYFTDSLMARVIVGNGGNYGVYGGGVIYGVYGNNGSSAGYGVYGNNSSTGYGVYGKSTSGYGVVGSSGYIGTYGSGSSYGLYGSGGTYGAYASGSSYGVYGSSSSGYGVAGISSSSYALYGSSSSSWGSVAYGVYGAYGSGTTGYGVEGVSSSNYGVYGYSGSNWAVYGNGYVGTYGDGSYTGAWGNGGSYGGVFYGGPYGVYGSGTSYAGYFNGNVIATAYSTFSDKNLKQNIQEFTSAMDILNKLKPRQYEYRHDGNYDQMNLPTGSHYGLIAQDVELVLPNLVKDSKFETHMKRPPVAPTKPDASSNPSSTVADAAVKSETISFKAVNYIELIPILIKAMQELHAKNEQLQNEIEVLRSTIAKAESVTDINAVPGYLKQNVPNPANGNTIISYYLPVKSSRAQITITNIKGSVVKSYSLSNGSGQVNIRMGELPTGTYNYALYVNNQMIDSRQMVIAQ